MILTIGLAMLRWSWGTWPDVLVDFGANLYLAWQLSLGNVAYGDVVYFKGPFSMYLNALWFRLFGVSLHTLVLCNLAILVVLLWLLYRLLSDIGDWFAATIACLVFITIFAFGQLVGIGNYNFVCPYSHEVTHGIFLSILAIACFSRYLHHRRTAWLGGAGFALGIIFLTEAHIFLSASLALLTGVGLALWGERTIRHRVIAALRSVIGWALVPLVSTFLVLGFTLSAERALRATFGAWSYAWKRDTYVLPFYQWVTGMLEPATNIHKMLLWMGWYAVWCISLAALSLALGKSQRHRAWITAGLCLALLVVLLQVDPMRWLEAVRPLPLIMVVWGAVSLTAFLGQRHHPQMNRTALLRVVCTLYAFALTGKMLLNVHTYHYGFALAMPGTLILVVALISWVPAQITQRGGYGGMFRSAALTVLLVVILAHLRINAFWFNQKTVAVSHGPDAFLADGRGLAVNAIVEELSKLAGPSETLAVFPEGTMLNYLTRRVNPLPYMSLPPFIVSTEGEERILATFEAHPPDYIALAHKDTSEEGYRFFGRDYAQKLFAWIADHYRAIRVVGAMPLRNHQFGILLFRRNRP